MEEILQQNNADLTEKFVDILEKDEKLLKVYKPNKKKFWWYVCLITIVTIVGIPFLPVVCLFAGAYYKKRFYAYSCKRVIIRGGIIGVDYKSLEFRDLTATVVKVGALDKMVKQNTGMVEFGSPGSPLGTNAAGMPNPYRYVHVEKPYDVMREIRELIEQTRNPKITVE